MFTRKMANRFTEYNPQITIKESSVMKVMSMLRYCIPSGADILLNFTHTMDSFAEWKAADSENNFLYHLF